jgi:DNA helicase-2/ATP-dependent DNA helicase PcrA
MDLSGLNESQKQAVESINGPLMVLAGAGSGKTKTLCSRIQYLLEELSISPYRVLAVTFSNKASKEMKHRVSVSTKVDAGALQITTFHAFCAKLLRFEAKYLGLSPSFSIYDDGESLAIIKALMGKRGISQKEVSPHAIKNYISEIKNFGYYRGRVSKYEFEDEEVDTDDEFYSIYEEYENELHKSNAVDFGGLITGVVELFEKHPEVLERYQNRYEYVLVDEYQDTNRAQFILINYLAARTKNICVVGDEDQSIYSWRGADIRNILDFEKVFPDAKLIKLEQNYRSSKNIIEAAGHVIGKNQYRKGKSMWTDNDQGESIHIIECNDDRREATFVADEIKSISKAGANLNDVSVFYRNNAQSRMMEDALRTNRIPYRVVAGIKFYERKEVKDLLSYLRVVVNGKDSLALSRIINVPARGIGTVSLRKIEFEAVQLQSTLWETIERIVENPNEYKQLKLSAKLRSALGGLVNLIQEVKLLNKNGAPGSEIFEKILEESGYLAYLQANKSYESLARIENLDELHNAIVQYEETNENANLMGFLETITLDSQKDGTEDGSGQMNGEVSLMTVHGSKGLEYPYVFLVGTEETVFPSYRSLEDGEMAVEEERRLFYVAMTRAMKRLYICFARGRMLWGSLKFNGPSRFLDEIPDRYYEWRQLGQVQKSFVKDGIDYDPEFSQESDFEEESYSQSEGTTRIISSTYAVGSTVSHKLYGPGKITKSEGHGNDEKVEILFSDGAKKKFMVKFAPLERI